MLVPVSLHRDLLLWVHSFLNPWLEVLSHPHRDLPYRSVSFICLHIRRLLDKLPDEPACLFIWFVVGPTTSCIRAVSWGSRRCPANLPLVTNPCHYTLRAVTAFALRLSDLNRGCKSTSLQESSECFTSLAWSLQEHRGVCTCKTSKHSDLPGFDGILKGFLY